MKKFKEIREKYRGKFPPSLVAAAVKIALDMGGAMTPATKKIERMKKGLSDDPIVKDALRQANESVKESADGSFKLVDMDDNSYKNALALAKKAKLNPFPKKTKSGMELSVFGDNKAIIKFIKSLPESVKEGTVQEGTWAVPDTKTKLDQFMNLISKPFFATTPKHIDQYLKAIPFGDDELYDALADPEYEKEADGSLKRPLVQLKKFPKVDLNQIAIDSLNGRWITAKKKGQGYDITHIMFDFNMDEVVKRKSGNLKPKRKMKLEL